MIYFKQETLSEVREELEPLLPLHWEEVAMYQDKIELSPDWDAYYAMEQNGNLIVFTLRDEEKLIGYNLFFLRTNPHYSDSLWAVNDIVYIEPSHRHDVTTPNFFDWCESQLRSMGAEVITYHMKVLKSFQTLMDMLDMDHAEHLYMKYIG